MHTSPIKISVVIITLNEERNLARCLQSVADIADEIVVMDSGSTDKTAGICGDYPVRFYQQAFRGYDRQKNDALEKAGYDYILSLDADEALTGSLRASILETKKAWSHGGYAFNRITLFCGKWVRHGEWYPDRVVRLFDRREARWEGKLHERLHFSPGIRMGWLRGDLLHYSYYSLSEYHRKTALYTSIAAMELYQKGVRPGMYHFYIKPLYRFIHAYLLQRGFLDGPTGFRIARLTASRLSEKFARLKRLRDQDKNKTNGPAIRDTSSACSGH